MELSDGAPAGLQGKRLERTSCGDLRLKGHAGGRHRYHYNGGRHRYRYRYRYRYYNGGRYRYHTLQQKLGVKML